MYGILGSRGERHMKRAVVTAVLAIAIVGACASVAQAESPHSANMSLIANWHPAGGDYQGSDMAFWGHTAVLGEYGGPGGFDLLDISNPFAPARLGGLACPGPQNDVSIWKDLVIVSVDSARGATTDDSGKTYKPEQCGAGGASQAESEAGTAWEGIRIVSIANPAAPVQIAAVKTDCGSHTHTLVPDPAHGRLIVYILSYPLGAPTPACNVASHRKISVVEIPLAAPASAKVVGSADVSPNIGCHDVSVFLARKIAGAGCISESQIWDISDPAKPKVIAHIPNPNNNIHHSAAFSWDGKTLILGDELGGAEVAPGCTGEDSDRFGGLWFYDVSDPANPVEKGAWKIPRQENSVLCTAHLFNVVPLRSDRDILVSAWYDAGLTAVDFTDPSKPKEIGFYKPMDPVGKDVANPNTTMWSAYWYNGHVYANNFAPRGVDIFNLKDPALDAEIPLDHLNPQVQEPLPPPSATPGADKAIFLPARAGCQSRRGFRIRLRSPHGQRARKALIYVGGRRALVVRGKKLRRPVALRRLPRGKTRIDVTLITRSGKRINRSRTYRFC
jgi:LVIVD repeat